MAVCGNRAKARTHRARRGGRGRRGSKAESAEAGSVGSRLVSGARAVADVADPQPAAVRPRWPTPRSCLRNSPGRKAGRACWTAGPIRCSPRRSRLPDRSRARACGRAPRAGWHAGQARGRDPAALTAAGDGSPSQCQQPLKGSRVRAPDVDDLRPASRAGYQRHGLRPDAEGRGDRGQGGCRGRAVHGARADADNERAIVLAAYARAGCSRPDPDRDPHNASIPGCAPHCTSKHAAMPQSGEEAAHRRSMITPSAACRSARGC